MTRATFIPLTMLAALAACGPPPPPRPIVAPPSPPAAAGLERVIGQDARALQLLFGAPDQDVREDKARKLQFSGAACVLDAYLYSPAPGREPIVTHVDTRLPNGDDFDRASCVAALSRRPEAR